MGMTGGMVVMAAMTRAKPGRVDPREYVGAHSERVKKSTSFFWSTSGRQSEGLHSVTQPLEIATGEFPAENGNRKEGC